MRLSERQKTMVQSARQELQTHPWFKGVCFDDLPTDDEIEKDFSSCVERVVMTTEWWDGGKG